MKKIAVIITILACVSSALAVNRPSPHERDYEWISRRHKARYIIAISRIQPFLVELDVKSNKSDSADGRLYHDGWRALFPTSYPFQDFPPDLERQKMVKKEYQRYFQLGFQVVQFNPEGLVVSETLEPAPLRLHDVVNRDSSVGAVFAEEPGRPGNHFYTFATWFYGFPGDKGHEFEPALCGNTNDTYRYATVSGLSAKYVADFNAKTLGTIGCREWAYQRKRPASLLGEGGFPPATDGTCKFENPPQQKADERVVCPGYSPYGIEDWQPYIDVTTRYGKMKPRIGTLIGWASFDDPPRPVIGQMGKYWICFHECPDGEAPGLIDNIRLWAARRGWPAPEDLKVPFFTDAKYGPTPRDWED